MGRSARRITDIYVAHPTDVQPNGSGDAPAGGIETLCVPKNSPVSSPTALSVRQRWICRSFLILYYFFNTIQPEIRCIQPIVADIQGGRHPEFVRFSSSDSFSRKRLTQPKAKEAFKWTYQNLRVNGNRLRSTLEDMAKIGGTPGGGVQRLTLSDEDKQARELLVKWLKEMDCEITIDQMGNIFGKRPGKNNDLPTVMSGSHVDSQPKGGASTESWASWGLSKSCGRSMKTISKRNALSQPWTGPTRKDRGSLRQWSDPAFGRESWIWTGPTREPISTERPWARNWKESASKERLQRKNGPCIPIMNSTSNRDPFWKGSASSSAPPREFFACTGTTCTSKERPTRSARPPWKGETTPFAPQRK